MGRRRRTGATDTYAVYDARGRRLAGNVDREVAYRTKEQARASGERDVTVIRDHTDREPGPRRLDP